VKLAEAVGGEVFWVQPRGLDRYYELRAGDVLLASLAWQTRCGSLARSQSSEGSWTFKRVGFFNPRVTVREAGSEIDIAVFWPRWLGDGTLEFGHGARFRWQSTNFWATNWMFTDDGGMPLVKFREGSPKGGWREMFKTQALVEIESLAADLPELPLLVLLGWYLMVLRNEDAAAGAAAVSAVAS